MENQGPHREKYLPEFFAPDSSRRGKIRRSLWLCVLCAVLMIALIGCRQTEGPAAATGAAETEVPATEQLATEPSQSEEPAAEPPETEPPAAETTEPYAPDDALLEAIGINPEIYGRLSYGDVDPQYIVHPTNNDVYMKQDAFGSYDREGAAFIDSRCCLDPRDTNVIIHGHNININNNGNGKAFATLFRFRDRDYMADYPVFTLETETYVQYYVPYALAVVETTFGLPDYFNIIEMNFSSEDSFNYYADYCKSHSLYRMPVKAETGDQLLTLSTCINDGNSSTELRLLVCLRLLREDETVEQMRQLYWLQLASYEKKLAWRQRQDLELK